MKLNPGVQARTKEFAEVFLSTSFGRGWNELEEHLAKNDVRAAAALLRHYLEHFAKDACDRLCASVEFGGDAQFAPGDLLPNATKTLGG